MAVDIITDNEFKDRLSDHEKVVVKFYADWCGNCRLFAPKFRRLSDDNRFEGVAFLDINAEKNPAARKVAGVSNLPYFAIFKDGNLTEGIATSREEAVVELIEKLKNM